MILASSLTLALTAPQLHIEPKRIAVGETVTIRAERSGQPLSARAIELQLPDGSPQDLGTTDAAGQLEFVPAVAGEHVVRLDDDGLLMLAALRVQPARSRWLVAAVTVPLGLALLWPNLRRLRRRRDGAPTDAPPAGGAGA
ncbi:MAG: hypothetical protein NXI31_15740 [bacterium]|nr:hypothetical protein [bacterium]